MWCDRRNGWFDNFTGNEAKDNVCVLWGETEINSLGMHVMNRWPDEIILDYIR